MAMTEREVLAAAREFQRQAADAEYKTRADEEDDLRFLAGEQWPETVAVTRGADRPTLVINRLPQHIYQVTNDFSQNRPAIQVHPVDDAGDRETADVAQGLIRAIEVASCADAAYDMAFESAARVGRGYVRLITQYAGEATFDQEPVILPVQRTWSVYFDPHSVAIDGSDATQCLIAQDMPKDVFKRLYPREDLANYTPDGPGDTHARWLTNEAVRIAEYFCLTQEPVNVVELSTGAYLFEDELPEPLPRSLTVVRTRKSHRVVVHWYKLSGSAVLDHQTLPGKYIPVVPFYGTRIFLPTEVQYSGMVRFAKDAQKMYNYWKSAETEHIALTPKAPYIAAAGQVEAYQREWMSANKANLAVLRYDPISLQGALVPPPIRQPFGGPDLAVIQAASSSIDDMKATTGIYDASLGNRSNETSGVAIRQRQQEGSTGNYHFVRNARMSIRHVGRILLSWISELYDTDRAVRIIGEDARQKVVRVSNSAEPQDAKPTKKGKTPVFNMAVGQYDVTIATGPAYATRRQEAVDGMLALAQANPEVWKIAGPQLVRQMDWPGAEEIAKQLEKAMPPELRPEPEDGKPDPEQQVMQLQQALQQMQQQAQALSQYGQEQEQELQVMNSKVVILQQKVDAKDRELNIREQESQARQELESQKLALEALKFEWQQATYAPVGAVQEKTEALEAEVGQDMAEDDAQDAL